MSTAIKKTEEEEFKLVSDVNFTDSKDSATIKYKNDSYDLFIGEELAKALATISDKTDEYFKMVINDSTTQTKTLLDENEGLKVVEVIAPIYSNSREDKLEILNVREEIEDTENEFKSLNVKVTQNISSPIVIQGAAALLRKK